MLQEFHRVRQIPDCHRRLFCDNDLDLWIWMDKPDGVILGFQLVWNNEQVYTWTGQEGAHLSGIMDEEVRYKKTPFLTRVEHGNDTAIIKAWRERSAQVPKDICSLVEAQLGLPNSPRV